MSVGVLDVGSGPDPDPRADLTVDLDATADVQADLEDKWPLADGVVKGIVASHVVEHLADPWHFFAEAARVLESGGWLEVTVPLGQDAHTDPDHEQVWTPGTPERFSDADGHGCQWDRETGFRLVKRDVSVWWFGPMAWASPLLDRAADRWPGWAAARCDAGELTARYRRVAR